MQQLLLLLLCSFSSFTLWGQVLTLNPIHAQLDPDLGLMVVNEDLTSLNATITSVSSFQLGEQTYDLVTPQENLQLGQSYEITHYSHRYHGSYRG